MAQAATLIREDQAIIQCQVTGINLPAVYSWASYEGGDVEAEDVKTRPGGLLPQVNLGGPAQRTDVTVKRQYSAQLHAFIVQLENVAGRAFCVASYTILDANGNPNGGTVTVTGILKTVQRPNWEANASNAAFLGLVIGVNQEATIQ
jgi:hypothetical protein